MKKNLIYVVAIDDPNAKIPANDYFQYSRPTWEHYCDRHDIDLIVQREHQFDDTIKPIWNKELISEIGKGYEKIGIVDSDTMVRWDAPNIFDQFSEDEFCGVNDLCDLNWLFKSIGDRQHFFPYVKMDLSNYLNAGVLFFGNRYLFIFERLLHFYIDYKDEIDAIKGGGREQTLLNFFLQQSHNMLFSPCGCGIGVYNEPLHWDDMSGKIHCSACGAEILWHQKVNIKKLSPAWNLLSIHRKNMFTHNWQLDSDKTPYFMKYAYVWHFTGFPIEDRVNVMRQTWEMTKHLYT